MMAHSFASAGSFASSSVRNDGKLHKVEWKLLKFKFSQSSSVTLEVDS